jgi:hypothetical protein
VAIPSRDGKLKLGQENVLCREVMMMMMMMTMMVVVMMISTYI